MSRFMIEKIELNIKIFGFHKYIHMNLMWEQSTPNMAVIPK